jgi:REP element-mobilizing transposase RayT
VRECKKLENKKFSAGYFLASIGNVSQEILKEYIENQVSYV